MTAAKKHKVNDRWTPEDVAEVRANTVVRLPVFCRYVDPRAAANPQAGEDGGTNLVELFGMEDRTRNEVVPGMELTPCYSGRGIDDGKQLSLCHHVAFVEPNLFQVAGNFGVQGSLIPGRDVAWNCERLCDRAPFRFHDLDRRRFGRMVGCRDLFMAGGGG